MVIAAEEKPSHEWLGSEVLQNGLPH